MVASCCLPVSGALNHFQRDALPWQLFSSTLIFVTGLAESKPYEMTAFHFLVAFELFRILV